MHDFHKILVATDGSDESTDAVEMGLDLAARQDAEIIFLRVAPATEWRAARGAPGRPIFQRLDGDSDNVLAAASAAADARGVSAWTELVAGEPTDVIVGLAEAVDADLIVVGSRERHLPFTGVSRSVARRARRPVLVAKYPKAA